MNFIIKNKLKFEQSLFSQFAIALDCVSAYYSWVVVGFSTCETFEGTDDWFSSGLQVVLYVYSTCKVLT